MSAKKAKPSQLSPAPAAQAVSVHCSTAKHQERLQTQNRSSSSELQFKFDCIHNAGSNSSLEWGASRHLNIEAAIQSKHASLLAVD